MTLDHDSPTNNPRIAPSDSGEIERSPDTTMTMDHENPNDNTGAGTQRMSDHPMMPMSTHNQNSEEMAYLAWYKKRGISATSSTGIRACVTGSGQNLQLPAIDGITLQPSSDSVLFGTHGQSRSQVKHRQAYEKWCRQKAVVRTTGIGAIPSDANNCNPKDTIPPVSLGRSESDLTAVPAKKARLDISSDASEYCYSCGSLNLYQIRQQALMIRNNPPPVPLTSATIFIICSEWSRGPKEEQR